MGTHTHTHFTFIGFLAEMLRCEDYNEKADVWSFGVVLWEVGEQGGRVACPCESSVLHCFFGCEPARHELSEGWQCPSRSAASSLWIKEQ